VATFDRRNRQLVAPLDRRRTYVDVMERVLGSSSLPDGRPQSTHIPDFTLVRTTSTVRFTIVEHAHVDTEDF
jgi:hypothetical protein